jgi:hypothetical protein
MRKFATTAILLSVGACASPTIWDKPGATQADFNRDSYECLKDAYVASVSEYVGYGFTQPTVNFPIYDKCMVAHGYASRPKG